MYNIHAPVTVSIPESHNVCHRKMSITSCDIWVYSPVPPPVQPITSIKVASNSITLSWSVDNYVTYSEVKWQETSDGSVATKADDNEGTSGRITDNTYTIRGLKGDTKYTIRVTVFNPLGNMSSQLITFTIENGIKYTAILRPCTAPCS